MGFYRCLSFCTAVLFGVMLAPTAALASELRLFDVVGTVQIKRVGQSQYRVARSGMRLSVGDRLLTKEDAGARIRCADFNFWSIHSNQELGAVSGCAQSLFSTRLRIGRQSDITSGGIDPTIPFIVSPRRTAVLDSQPMLRWNPVADTSDYTVQVVGPGVTWVTKVSDTEVQYPGIPQLMAGAEYRAIVEAENGRSSQLDEGATIATFELLYPEDVQIVEADIAKLEGEELSPEARSLTIADIYIREELFADAIAELEPFVASETNTYEVYQDLGNIYRYIGLNLLAEERYDRAIAIASANDDSEGTANAQSGLAEIKVLLDDPDAAVELLRSAKVGYETVENTERVEELQARIDELSSP